MRAMGPGPLAWHQDTKVSVTMLHSLIPTQCYSIQQVPCIRLRLAAADQSATGTPHHSQWDGPGDVTACEGV